ncbi:hypothetical protein RND81_06G221500 [Saponaria officinalis]|uniref:RING-type domain-containing protein n=1 Tax=Saponaria officinalis TaxID=3572 RepID=A0AAW1KCY9_SAPOF
MIDLCKYECRNIQENKNIILGSDNILHPQQVEEEFLEQSHMFFNNNGGINPRKRSRENRATETATTVNSFNLSQQNHQLIDISQLQNHQQQQQQQQHGVSTGLKLSFGEQNQQQIQQHHPFASVFSEDLTFRFKQQSDELNYFLNAQGEQLRRTLAEKTQRHYRALLHTAEEAVSRRVAEKQAEVETAIRRNVELQARAAQMSAEAQAWQAKAQNQELQAMSLQAQIQQAIRGPNNIGGPLGQDREGSGAGDAESSYVDPTSARRVRSSGCKVCRTRDACVVLLPCRHLCVCVQCDNVAQTCPVCYSLRSASVEVYFN